MITRESLDRRVSLLEVRMWTLEVLVRARLKEDADAARL